MVRTAKVMSPGSAREAIRPPRFPSRDWADPVKSPPDRCPPIERRLLRVPKPGCEPPTAGHADHDSVSSAEPRRDRRPPRGCGRVRCVMEVPILSGELNGQGEIGTAATRHQLARARRRVGLRSRDVRPIFTIVARASQRTGQGGAGDSPCACRRSARRGRVAAITGIVACQIDQRREDAAMRVARRPDGNELLPPGQ